MIHHEQKNKGFTLVELIVAVGVFAIVITIALGALIGILDANRKIRITRTATDNVNNVLDQMVREIGSGKLFYCEASTNHDEADLYDCESGTTEMSFRTQASTFITYRLNNNAVERRENGSSYERLTGDDIVIEDLEFRVFGNEDANIQPKAFVTIQGQITANRTTPSNFDIQTTIIEQPQRAPNLTTRPTELDICPFADVTGRIVVDFTEVKNYYLTDSSTQQCIAANDDTGACETVEFDLSDSRFLGGTIPSGTYTVTVASFDNNLQGYAPGEVFFLELQNDTGSEIISTAYTGETERIAPTSPTSWLPSSDPVVVERLANAAAMGQCFSGECLRFNKPATIVLEDTLIDEEVFFIVADGGTQVDNSVIPLCAAFDPTDIEDIDFDEF